MEMEMEMKMEIESTNAIEICYFFPHLYASTPTSTRDGRKREGCLRLAECCKPASKHACIHDTVVEWHSCCNSTSTSPLPLCTHITTAGPPDRRTAGPTERPTHRHPLNHTELSARRRQSMRFASATKWLSSCH